MGLHTGEPTVGEEGYLGLDVVRAARICSAGHGGQILLSETTRSLIGNDLPEGASVLDLGEAKLKDIQHERLFQLSVDGEQHSFPPLKTEVEKSAEDLLGERIQAHVERQLDAGVQRRRRGAGSDEGCGRRLRDRGRRARRVPARRAGRDPARQARVLSQASGATRLARRCLIHSTANATEKAIASPMTTPFHGCSSNCLPPM